LSKLKYNSELNWSCVTRFRKFRTREKDYGSYRNFEEYLLRAHAYVMHHIMLRDELTQKFSHFDKITVFEYPRACRFRKPHQTNQFWSLRLPTFFKMWFKGAWFFQVVEHIRDILRMNTVKNETFSKKSKNSIFGQFLPILATFYEVKITFWKKMVGGAVLWGIQKQ
jgi:hypothetical protein